MKHFDFTEIEPTFEKEELVPFLDFFFFNVAAIPVLDLLPR